VIVHHCCWNQVPVPFSMPSMSGIWPVKTWMPTPVRNPINTEDDRKSPMKPSRSSRASSSRPPQTRAVSEVNASHSGE